MHILVLGAGGIGESTAVTMAAFEEISELIIADIDLRKAQQVASRCCCKTRATPINAAIHSELVELMRQADLILNCIGPSFRFSIPVLEAAIAAKRDYCDVCSSPEPTLQMLKKSEEAKAADIIAIVGNGACPGLTNLLAKMAFESLDQVEELITAWNVDCFIKTGKALDYSTAIVDWMRQISGTILEYHDHQLQNVRPLQEKVLHYPGRGDRVVWTVGHSEPVAFSRSYPPLKISYCAMIMPSHHIGMFHKLQKAIDKGRFTLEQAAQALVDASQRKSWLEQTMATISHWFEGPAMPPLLAVAKGTKDGLPATTAASLRATPDSIPFMTGVPLALTAQLFARGKIAAKGVFSPEKVLDPRMFFNLLHPYCNTPQNIACKDLVELATECSVAPSAIDEICTLR